jgi:hypothetical protein
MKYLPSQKNMSDKERILLYVLTGIRSQTLWIPSPSILVEEDKPHFDVMQREPAKIGELVMSSGSGIHPFTVGFLVDTFNSYDYKVREIGSGKTCVISNDSFSVIRGMPSYCLYEGKQYKAFRDVNLAFLKIDDSYRLGESEFNTDGNLTVSVREKFGGFIRGDRFVSEGFNVILPANKPSIKSYEQLLRDGGVGSRPFRVFDTLTNQSLSKEEYKEICNQLALG